MKPSNRTGKAASAPRYTAEIATETADIHAALALRYRIFQEEMGAQLHSRLEGLDYDEFDDYCDHLIVRDRDSHQVVACTRLLPDDAAARLGHFYSQGEFHLDRILSLPGRILEIGRTCVDPDHRGSVVLGTLWSGLSAYVYQHRFDYLMGCASISPGPSGFAVDAVYRQIRPEQLGPIHLAVRPKRPIPFALRCIRDESGIPPLLQAYLRLGCWVCGEPCWDEDFNVMDVFILLDLSRIHARYEKRFISNHPESEHAFLPAMV